MMSKRQRTNNSSGTRQQSTLLGLWKSSSSSCHPSVEHDNDNNDDKSINKDNNSLSTAASKNAASAAAAASSSLLLLQNKQPQWKNISIQSNTNNNNGPMLLLRGGIKGMNKKSSSSSIIRKSLTALPDWKENVTFNAFGRQCTMRRRICQYSLQGKFTYSYSGLKNVMAPPFPANLYDIKRQVEDMMIDYILNNMNRLEGDLCLSQEFIDLIKKSTNNCNDEEEANNSNNNKRIDIFNYCLLNHYRNGEEYMSYHSDDESSLCPYSPIASVSLGTTRSFDIRHKNNSSSSSSSSSSSNKNDKKRSRIARIPLGDGDVLLMFPPMQEHYEHSIPVEKRVIGERINLTFRRLL
jgi:hypothetical protein